ncbi:hypothetical protein GCM10022224_008640 [Nonomuraea antimicrobica]|uniref:PASTA domain-containing protein n=1 Tax=Nonomuraea antimicrobica TaxID=561173 RepID=A0ABP7B4R4_9ACTN
MVLLWLIIIVLVIALVTSAISPEFGQKLFVWRRLPLGSARLWSITALVVLAAGMFLYRDAVTYDPAWRLAEKQREDAAEQAERDEETEKLIKSGDARELGVEPGSDQHTGHIVGYRADPDTGDVRVVFKVSTCAGLLQKKSDENGTRIRVRIVEDLECRGGLADVSVPATSPLVLDAPISGRRVTTWDGTEIPRCEADPERAKACDVVALARASRIGNGEARRLGLKPESDRLSGRIIGYRPYVDSNGDVDDSRLVIVYSLSPCADRGSVDDAVEEKAREVTVSLFEESSRGGGVRLTEKCTNRYEYLTIPRRVGITLGEPLGDRRLVVAGGDEIPACDADPRRKRQCDAAAA